MVAQIKIGCKNRGTGNLNVSLIRTTGEFTKGQTVDWRYMSFGGK